MQRIELMGCPMDVATMDETVDVVREAVREGGFLQHSVVNVAKLVRMCKDPQLDQSVRSCDMINIDGMGLVFGARFLGQPIRERVAGIDLFHELVAMSAEEGFPIFLLGATAEVAAKTAEILSARHPNLKIAGHHHGYFWADEHKMVQEVRASGAKLLFVAITSPKKENFIAKWRDELGVNFVMGVGGTFDVVAGKVKRAPVWVQVIGAEWLFRALQEPRRLLSRYLYTNTVFAWLLLRERCSPRRA